MFDPAAEVGSVEVGGDKIYLLLLNVDLLVLITPCMPQWMPVSENIRPGFGAHRAFEENTHPPASPSILPQAVASGAPRAKNCAALSASKPLSTSKLEGGATNNKHPAIGMQSIALAPDPRHG